MVATAATSAFFPVPSSSDSLPKPPRKVNGVSNLGGLNPPASGRSSVKANAQAPHKVNGTRVDLVTASESVKIDDSPPPVPPPRTFINQLPDWSVLLAAITTVFLAAEKQWTLLDWKPKRMDILVDPFGLGSIFQDGLIFRQDFSIRSYEIGADRTASIETIMNHFQETSINHVKSAGLLDDGFGSTPEMYKRDLIWVVTKMQVLVDRYPAWGDTVQVQTWVSESGKNGMRRDWLVRDCSTGEVMTRASSLWVLMNKKTRRLSKIPEEVRREIEPYFMNSDPVVEDDNRKLTKLDEKTADIIRTGLTPHWTDLDVNQHVNNVKYIGWILESAPSAILESHELSALTLEYRRECWRDSVLQSLTAVSGNLDSAALYGSGEVECQHLLRLEGGAEVLKGRTEWRPKSRPAGDAPA